MIGKSVDGTFVKWLSADELKALNLTTNDIIVNNADKPVALSTEGTGTYYKKFGDVYAAAAWDFSGSPIAIFGIDAYDGNPESGAASMYGANAGFVKAHLAKELLAGSLTVYVDGENFTSFQTISIS